MGDTVQRLLEEMVPELEDLTKRQIFTEEEVKAITRKRENFEYLLLRRNPEVGDFLRYIDYELVLDRLRIKRKERKGLKRNTLCDFAIVRRVHYLYDRLLRKWPGDIELWLRYIEWSIGLGSTSRLGKIFTRVLQLHPQESILWAKAADWAFQANDDAHTARTLVQRGIRLNPSSPELWLFFFRLEIEYINRFRERKSQLGLMTKEEDKEKSDDMKNLTDFLSLKEHSDTQASEVNKIIEETSEVLDEKDRKILSGELPKWIFQNAIKIPAFAQNFSFRLQFLNLIPPPPLQAKANEKIKQFKDLVPEEDTETKKEKKRKRKNQIEKEWPFGELKTTIYESLLADFPEKEESWDQMARGKLELSLVRASYSGNSEKEKNSDFNPSESDAILVFEEAVQKLPTARMWELYISFLFQRWQAYKALSAKLYQKSSALSGIIEWLSERLTDIFSRTGKQKDTMTEESFRIWIQFLTQGGNQKEAWQISELSLTKNFFPLSVQLWVLHLNLATERYHHEAKTTSDDSQWNNLCILYKQALQVMEKVEKNEHKSKELVKEGVGRIWNNFIDLHIQRAKASGKHADWQASSECFRLAIRSLATLIPESNVAASVIEEIKLQYLNWVLGALNSSTVQPTSQSSSNSEDSDNDSDNDNETTDSKISSFLELKDIENVINYVLESTTITNTITHATCELFLKAIEIQTILDKKQTSLSKEEDVKQEGETRIKSFLEKAVTLYGTDSSEVWLKYVSYFMDLGDIASATRIHWRALKTLSPAKHAPYLLVYKTLHSSSSSQAVPKKKKKKSKQGNK